MMYSQTILLRRFIQINKNTNHKDEIDEKTLYNDIRKIEKEYELKHRKRFWSNDDNKGKVKEMIEFINKVSEFTGNYIKRHTKEIKVSKELEMSLRYLEKIKYDDLEKEVKKETNIKQELEYEIER